MKNTLMFLLVSLTLSLSLTACGGDSQQGGAAGDYDSTGQTSGSAGTGSSADMGGSAGTGSSADMGGSTGTGSSAGTGSSGGTGGSLLEDTKDALDDAGRAVRNTVDDAARGF